MYIIHKLVSSVSVASFISIVENIKDLRYVLIIYICFLTISEMETIKDQLEQ